MNEFIFTLDKKEEQMETSMFTYPKMNDLHKFHPYDYTMKDYQDLNH